MYTEKDFYHMENLLKILKDGEFTLSGEQALAFTNTFAWFVSLRNNAKEQLDKAKQKKEMMGSINLDSKNKDVGKEPKIKAKRMKKSSSTPATSNQSSKESQ